MTVSHIYDFHIFTVIYLPLYRFIWNQHNDQLPVALLAQFVERHWFKSRTGMNFFRALFHYCFNSVHFCEDRFHFHNIVTVTYCFRAF